jgi:transmembrane sensor
MSREIFHDLLEKYQKGLCTDAEKQIVAEWYGLLDSDELDQEPEELSALEQKLWNKINAEISKDEPTNGFNNSKGRWGLKLFLAVAAVFCISLILIVLNSPGSKDQNSVFLADRTQILQTITNTGAVPKLVVLEDGSQVTLESKASLTFPNHFKQSLREVSLKGNGFFLISKDPGRPFLVYNKQINTRVLGTSFSIWQNPKTNETEVTVKTGKVLVRKNEAHKVIDLPDLFTTAEEVILIPNEKTSYNASRPGFKTTLADNPVPVLKPVGAITASSFRFNDTPVKEVIAGLMVTYGIEIIVESEELKNNTFTGDLTAQNLYNKLDFLCQSIAARYEVVGTQIIIKKK